MRFAWVGLLVPITLAGCPDINEDPDELVSGPQVEFDPGASIIPFPNNLVIDPATGLVNLPEQCNESATQTALRTQVLNTLDGFGTFKPALQVTLTTPIDPATATDSIALYQMTSGTTPLDPAA